jgi:hypothetical protein
VPVNGIDVTCALYSNKRSVGRGFHEVEIETAILSGQSMNRSNLSGNCVVKIVMSARSGDRRGVGMFTGILGC